MTQGPDFLPPEGLPLSGRSNNESAGVPVPETAETQDWHPPTVDPRTFPPPPVGNRPAPLGSSDLSIDLGDDAAAPDWPAPNPAAFGGAAGGPAPAQVVERPHPLTGLARGGIALVAGLYFVTRELLEGGPGFSASFLFIGLGLLGMAIIAGISGIFTWRTTTFVADDDEFRIERRFISQSSSRVDYTKVQAVDIAQPLIARLMGLAKVHIDVGGAGGLDIAFLSKGRAESLREHLVERMQRAQAPLPYPPPIDAVPSPGDHPVAAPPAIAQHPGLEEPVVEVPARNLLVGTFVSLGTASALIGAGVVVAIAVWADAPVTSLAALVGVGGWIWRQTGRNWNFRMTKRDGALRITRGALSTTAQGLRPGRIQGVAVKQDLLQRLTGLHQMTVTVLGYGDPTGDEHRQTNAVVLPFGTWHDVLTVLHTIWPDVDLSRIQPHAQPERAKWLTPFSFGSHTWGIGEQVVVTQHGVLERTFTIVPHRRMQSASIRQGPLQRRLGLALIHVHTTDGPVVQSLHHLDEAVARQVFDEQIARARAARAVTES